MNEVEPNEQIYTDYKDHEHRNPTNIKFKTTVKRIRFWVAAHEEIFTEPSLYEFRQDLITLKHKDRSKKNLIVKWLSLSKDRDTKNGNPSFSIP